MRAREVLTHVFVHCVLGNIRKRACVLFCVGCYIYIYNDQFINEGRVFSLPYAAFATSDSVAYELSY